MLTVLAESQNPDFGSQSLREATINCVHCQVSLPFVDEHVTQHQVRDHIPEEAKRGVKLG